MALRRQAPLLCPLLWLLCLALLAAEAASAQERQTLRTSTAPQVRAGQVFAPAAAVAGGLRATYEFSPLLGTVELRRDDRVARMRIGRREATVQGRAVRLDAAPFVQDREAMVPVRFVAEALGSRIRYDARTRSVLFGPGPAGAYWALPLESSRAGIVIHSPRPGEEVASPVRVHGQANVFEGHVVVQLKSEEGKTLAEGFGTAAMGTFLPFTVELAFDPPEGEPMGARIVAFSPSPKDGKPTHTVTVPVTLR